MSIWAIVLLLMLLLTDFRMVVFNWLGGMDTTLLIVLFILVWNWYYRW